MSHHASYWPTALSTLVMLVAAAGCTTVPRRLPPLTAVPAAGIAATPCPVVVPPAGTRLGVADAIALALANDPRSESYAAAVLSAQCAALASADRAPPEVRVSGDEGALVTGLRYRPANQRLRAAQRRRAEAALGLARATGRLDAWRLAQTVRETMVELSFMEADLTVLDELLALRRQQHARIRQIVADHQATVAEQLRSARRVLAACTEQHALTGERDRQQQVLATLLGLGATQIVPLDLADPELRRQIDPPSLDVDSLVAQALAAHPSLAPLEAQCSDAVAAVSEAEAETRSHVSFVEGSVAPWVHDSGDRWRIQAGVAVPLSRLPNYTVRSREAEARFGEATLSAARADVERSVASAVARLRSANAALESYRGQTNDLVRELEAGIKTLADADQALPEAAVESRVAVLESRRHQLRLEREQQRALLALEQAVGMTITD